MSTQQQSELRPITRGQWLKAVDDLGGDLKEPRGSRTHRRHQTQGAARLSSPPDANNSGNWIHARARVVGISAGGISLRSEQVIPVDSHVDLELYLAGDDAFTLSGTVVHCTQSVSGFSVGIELLFPD